MPDLYHSHEKRIKNIEKYVTPYKFFLWDHPFSRCLEFSEKLTFAENFA